MLLKNKEMENKKYEAERNIKNYLYSSLPEHLL